MKKSRISSFALMILSLMSVQDKLSFASVEIQTQKSIFNEKYLQTVITVGMSENDLKKILGSSIFEENHGKVKKLQYFNPSSKLQGTELGGFEVNLRDGKVETWYPYRTASDPYLRGETGKRLLIMPLPNTFQNQFGLDVKRYLEAIRLVADSAHFSEKEKISVMSTVYQLDSIADMQEKGANIYFTTNSDFYKVIAANFEVITTPECQHKILNKKGEVGLHSIVEFMDQLGKKDDHGLVPYSDRFKKGSNR